MLEPYRVGEDIVVLPTSIPLGPDGHLLINAYVILAEEPVLIDSGLGFDRADFISALSSIVPPEDLRWIWLTHDDADHTGNIQAIADVATQARIATNAFNAMRMSTWWPVPMERVYAIRPGDGLDVGDRTLRAVSPPVFDNPNSVGLLDESNGTLFTVDAFGAIIPEITNDADQIPPDMLTQGMIGWGVMDAPWTGLVDTGRFDDQLKRIVALDPSRILSSHLPAAGPNIERYADVLRMLPSAEPQLPPDHATFTEMLAATQ